MSKSQRMKAYGDKRMTAGALDAGMTRMLWPISDDAQSDPPDGLGGIRIDSNGNLYIKLNGVAETLVSPPVTLPPSLSDYQNVIVVDAGGNGDYTTLGAASITENAGKNIIVVSSTTETSSIALPAGGINIYILPGVVVNMGKISKGSAGEPYYCWHTTVNNTIDVSTNVKTRPTETNTFTVSKHRGTNE